MNMISRILLATLFIPVCFSASAQQAPGIEFSKVFGGSRSDVGWAVMQTADRGYLVTGMTYSTDGTMPANTDMAKGDIVLIKTDSTGKQLWRKVLAGSNSEHTKTLAETSDSYLLGGMTVSKDGDYAGLPGGTNGIGFIAWINKSTGQVKSIKGYQGDVYNEVNQIKVVDSSHLVVVGAKVNTKNRHGVYGSRDVWIAKLDLAGKVLWEQMYGGTSEDFGFCITPKKKTAGKDRGYMVGGYALSGNYDVKGNHGTADAWILNLDSTGAIIWAKCYGGSDGDRIYGINEEVYIEGTQTRSKYLMIGSSLSTDYDLAGLNKGKDDFWAIKIDDVGQPIWSKTYGGSDVDFGIFGGGGNSFTSDNGAIIYGYTTSIDGDVSGRTVNQADAFLVRIDKDGKKVWAKSYGSALTDGNTGTASVTCDDGYIFTLGVSEISQDVSGTGLGDMELWLCKLESDGLDNANCSSNVSVGVSSITPDMVLEIAPNPASSYLSIKTGAVIDARMNITDIAGRTLLTERLTGNNTRIDISSLPAGMYIIQLHTEDGQMHVRRFVKQ